MSGYRMDDEEYYSRRTGEPGTHEDYTYMHDTEDIERQQEASYAKRLNRWGHDFFRRAGSLGHRASNRALDAEDVVFETSDAPAPAASKRFDLVGLTERTGESISRHPARTFFIAVGLGAVVSFFALRKK